MTTGLGALLAPVPAAWAVFGIVYPALSAIASDSALGYSTAVVETLWYVWPGLVVSLALAALAMWLCLRRQAQYAMPHTGTWAMVVLLLGVPALLGYPFHRVWPTRLACPACGVRVPRDRTACSHCSAALPEPEVRGTEVLA